MFAVNRAVSRYSMFWAVVTLFAAVFIFEAAIEIAARRPGDVALQRVPWLTVHAALAVPLFLIAPLQFSGRVRKSWPSFHRWLGRAFMVFSLVAASTALVLGVTIANPGARVPLGLFATVWIAFLGVAWIAALAGDMDTHRRFVIRSLAIGFAFVWVRVLRLLIDQPLESFMPDAMLRSTTREWLGFVVPLLLVETWLTWWPASKRAWAKLRARNPHS